MVLTFRPVIKLLSSVAIITLIFSSNAMAWGDAGHEIVALIADHYLTPQVREQVHAILNTDTSKLTTTNMAAEATWADRYRSSHRETAAWHFVDTELRDGDIDSACFGHPTLPLDIPASQGTAQDCVVDKIDQFMQELASPDTSDAERLMALQFLLHFVGDEHQPLHSSDEQDRGGNDKKVSATGITAGNLHSYWDTAFVQRLGTDISQVASNLIAHISNAQIYQWQQQTPRDWSLEAYNIAKTDIYGKLPAPSSTGSYRLPTSYVNNATYVVAIQLSRAGVRLAKILNDSLTEAGIHTVNSKAAAVSPFASH